MYSCCLRLRHAMSSSLTVLARRGHVSGDGSRALARAALLERAAEDSVKSSVEQQRERRQRAEYVRSVDARVEATRQAILTTLTPLHVEPLHAPSAGPSNTTETTTTTATSSSSSSGLTIVSLTHFLHECKRHRVDVGCARSPEERRQRREDLRRFWRQHADSAVQCCATLHPREFGFVAIHGLSDDALHLHPRSILAAYEGLRQEVAVCSCVDMFASLHYLLRELKHQQGIINNNNNNPRGSAPHAHHRGRRRPEDAPHDELRHLDVCLTDMALERINFFFVRHAVKQDGVMENAEEAEDVDGGTTSRFARADDALTALEVLALINVESATDAVAHEVVCATDALYATNTLFASSNRPTTTQLAHKDDVDGVAVELQRRLATVLFLHITAMRRQLKFTSIVQSFALLRVFMRALWPPYRHDRGAHTKRASSSSTNSKKEPRSLREESVALQRIAWGLALALKSRDSRFVNPFHLVKIVTTLERLPACTLANNEQQHAHSQMRMEVRSLEALGLTANPHWGPTRAPPTQHRNTSITPADFWRYVVSKAVLLLPSLPLSQRRLVCHALHLSIAEKRRSSFPPSTRDEAPPTNNTLVPLTDSSTDLLLPLVEEMAKYDEDFHTSVDQASRGRPPPRTPANMKGGGRRNPRYRS